MSDEYQLRKDVDRLIDDIYGVNSRIVAFADDSQLRGIFTNEFNSGTIDALFEYYGLYDHEGGGGGGDLSNYYTKTEINGILSSYVTNQTLEDYALKSELFSGSYEDLTDVPSSFPPSTHTHNWDSVTGKPSTFPPSTHTHDDRYYTESETDILLNGKAPSVHNHTTSQITDLYIPTKTSDLTNNGEDGINAFVSSNDSRLSDNRNPNPHTHGNITNDGKLSTSASSTKKIVVTDLNDNLGTASLDSWNIGTFTELQLLIGTTPISDRVLVLDKDYQNAGNESEITVPDGLTIIGNDHIIDADSKSRIFNLGGGITLQGITFQNGKVEQGNGGAIYTASNVCSIIDCNFIDNNARYGGAIYCTGFNTIKNCGFVNSAPQSQMTGEWIYNSGNSFNIYGCKVYNVMRYSDDFYGVVEKEYLTEHQSLTNYIQKSSTSGLVKNDGSIDTTQYLSSLPTHNHDDRYYTESEVDTALNGKQATLVSGTNIKTVNGNDLLGSGDIVIGATGTIDDTVTQNSPNPVKSSGIYSALSGKANASHSHSISDITNLQSALNDKVDKSDLLDLIYPIGAIYMSVNSTNPSVLLGGTWEHINNCFLLASEGGQGLGQTGGEATHTLTVDEMPRHTHEQNPHHHSFNRYQNTGSTTHYGASWVNQKLISQNTSDTTATNKNTGGGQAHNNMPPYLIVNVWKRTA